MVMPLITNEQINAAYNNECIEYGFNTDGRKGICKAQRDADAKNEAGWLRLFVNKANLDTRDMEAIVNHIDKLDKIKEGKNVSD